MCCHLDLFRQDADCEFAFNDNFASCHSMFRNLAPRRSLWVVGLLSLFGSVFVVGWQYFLPDNNMVQSIMLVNLGISDGIMGIYLIIIGIKDLQWSGEYYLHDYEWRTGWFCHFNGAMSVLSSEVSVMMISLIAWDRLKNIVFPYTFAKITPRQTRIMCVVIWLVGGIMAFLPLSGMRYFGDWYYGKNVVCLPLQLSPQLQEGWEFSTSIFIVLNFSLFLFITVAYVAILLKSWSSSRRLGAHGTVREIRARAQSAQAKRERALAKRVFFIILTDFLCWIPIIAIGIKSHVEKTFDPPGDLAVWIAVFALPINSAINPLLYTLSTPQVPFFSCFWMEHSFICCFKRHLCEIVIWINHPRSQRFFFLLEIFLLSIKDGLSHVLMTEKKITQKEKKWAWKKIWMIAKLFVCFSAVGYNHGDQLEFKSGLIYIPTYFIS